MQGGGVGITTSVTLLLWIGIGTSVSETSVVIKSAVSTIGCNWNVSGAATATIATTLASNITTLAPAAITSIYDKYS